MPEPPFTITSSILDLVVQIAEEIGRFHLSGRTPAATPRLRRSNRIKSIHASLAIENNSLSLEQVTALIEGKRVLGPPGEVQEVKNAFAAYESLDQWDPAVIDDFLTAHRLLMEGLVDRPGTFRSGSVGIAQGEKVVHVAPPAHLVPGLVGDLFRWLESTDTHPLIASCVIHYELEFIHPFSDGNGRIGRLWQTLTLSRWKAPLAYLPIEDVIRQRQEAYYDALAVCDKAGNSTAFIDFMLEALLTAVREVEGENGEDSALTDQVSDQVSDQVKALLRVLRSGPLSALECMNALGLSHRPTFRKNYLHPALEAGLVGRTIPEKPNSRLQKYRLVR
jgi:Fic family protein